MYEEIRNNFAAIAGTPLTLSDNQIEEAIMGNPELGPQFIQCPDDAAKADFIRANLPAITASLSGGSETAAAAVPGTKKGKKEAIQPSDEFKAMNAAAQDAINAQLVANDDVRKLNSRSTVMSAVLIQRACPSEWMKGVPQCSAKEGTTAYKEMTEFTDTSGEDVLQWLSSHPQGDASIIPTDAQLDALAAEHKRRWAAKNPGKEDSAYKAPDWATAHSNDADVQAIRALLNEGKPFDVLVGSMAGDESTHSKPWRWNTKGFVLQVPQGVGTADKSEQYVSFPAGLRDFLFLQTSGLIMADADKIGMSAKLVQVKPRATAKNAGKAQKSTVGVRVLHNRNTNEFCPQTIAVTEPKADKKGKMGVKSALSYLVVRAVKPAEGSNETAVNFRVTRRRLSLIWEEAPVFATVEGMLEKCPDLRVKDTSKKAVSKTEQATYDNLIRSAYADVLTADKAGLSGASKAMREQLDSQVNAAVAAEAASLA